MLIFGFKERPRPFCSDLRPRRGRHILAPRDPGDPATLPTLPLPPSHTYPVLHFSLTQNLKTRPFPLRTLFRAFTSALPSTSARTTSPDPRNAARCSGVHPSCRRAPRLSPAPATPGTSRQRAVACPGRPAWPCVPLSHISWTAPAPLPQHILLAIPPCNQYTFNPILLLISWIQGVCTSQLD